MRTNQQCIIYPVEKHTGYILDKYASEINLDVFLTRDNDKVFHLYYNDKDAVKTLNNHLKRLMEEN